MKEKHSHIFDSTEHIDESTLWLYAQGELHKNEVYEVEKHLVDCEMCSDIVDGFSKFDTEGSYNAAINRISESFFNPRKRKHKILIRKLSIAAGFILIATSGFFIFSQLNLSNNSKNQLATETTTKTKFQQTEYIFEKTEYENLDDTNALENRQIAKDNIANEKGNIEQISKFPETKDEISEKNIAIINTEQANVEALEIVENETEPEIEEILINANFDNNESIETEMALAESIQSMTNARGIANTEQINEAAVGQTEVVSRTDEIIDQEEEISFKSGMDAYYKEDYMSAIQILKNIPKSSADYWDAHWIIADSYVKSKKIDEAKAEYLQIKNSDNPYQYAAKEKLLELE